MDNSMYDVMREAHRLGMKDESAHLANRHLPSEGEMRAYHNGRKRQKRFEGQVAVLAEKRGKSAEEILVDAMNALWNRAPREEVPAKGVRGILFPEMGGGPIFRVYCHSEDYRHQEGLKKAAGAPHDEEAWCCDDYRVVHCDLDIIIDEQHASLYVMNDGQRLLDYDSGTLTPKRRNVRYQADATATGTQADVGDQGGVGGSAGE